MKYGDELESRVKEIMGSAKPARDDDGLTVGGKHNVVAGGDLIIHHHSPAQGARPARHWALAGGMCVVLGAGDIALVMCGLVSPNPPGVIEVMVMRGILQLLLGAAAFTQAGG